MSFMIGVVLVVVALIMCVLRYILVVQLVVERFFIPFGVFQMEEATF